MKNILLIIFGIFLILTDNRLFAQSITINTAKEIAKNHMLAFGKSHLKSARINQVKYQLSVAETDSESKDTLYFVLNDTINRGFVIVAADKRSWPILGYSLEKNFDKSNQPPAFIDWMENRRKEIAIIKKNNLTASDNIAQQWERLSSVNYSEETTTVGPLIQTTWDQGCYYNSLCPFDSNGPCDHVLTGCVATAMAQIMKYWNYPEYGTGSHSYVNSPYGTLTANFSATTYQWAQMPNNVTAQNDAVATLMFHCGVAVNMDYGANSSSAVQEKNALVNYFGYSPNAQHVYKSSYSSTDWVNLMKFELDSHRPIWYGGYGSYGGHAFICDGYQNSDYFHINWGWSGYQDGYFYLGSLNPGQYDFNNDQDAVIKLFPNKQPDDIGAITGPIEVCQGQASAIYSVPAIQNAATYSWTLPSGATGTSKTNTINVSFGSNAQSGVIKVKAQNSLGTSNESSLNITINQLPGTPGPITGKTMVCPGISENYSITPISGATSYIWEIPTGWTGTSTSTSITVIPGSSGGTIKVVATNGKCSGSSSNLAVATGIPVSPTSLSASSTTITPGQATTLQVNGGTLNSAPNWIWTTGNCEGIQVGKGVSLLVSPNVTTTYYVQASGCGVKTTCKSITINYCTAPANPSSASSSIGSPSNGSNHYVNFSVATVVDAEGYVWDYSFDNLNWSTNWYETTCSGNCYSYVNVGDKPNAPVYFRVRAYKCSPKQYSDFYFLPKIYTACDDPSAPMINGITSNSLNITLNAETPTENPDITTYSIYCSTTAQYVQANGTLGNIEVFQTKKEWGTKTVSGLSNNTQYCFYAKARNSDGDIRFNISNSACGTPKDSPPIANFSANVLNGCSPLTINFNDESTGVPTSWNWDVDNDGTIDYTIKNPTHSYSKPGIYTVKLTVSNNSGSNSKTQSNYITVNPVINPAVTIYASPSSTFESGQLISFNATPLNGGSNPSYQWSVDGINVGSNTSTYSTTSLINNQVVRCTMTPDYPCASPAIATSEPITVTVKPLNREPIANAGPNQTVNEGISVTLDGSLSSDPDGDPISYQWKAPTGIILSSYNVAKPTFAAPEVTEDTPFTFTLVVNDGKLYSYVDQVVIIIKQVNKAPTANAGMAQTVNEGASVQLDGTNSTDADGNTLTYQWIVPTGITLSSPTGANPTFSAPEVTEDTSLVFTLIVNDGMVNSIPDQVVITVKQVNKVPTANAGIDQNIDEGATITLDGSLSFDPESDPLTYKWIAPPGITLSSDTAVKPTFVAPEVTQDTPYTFRLIVNDGKVDSSADQVIILVKQVNKAPTANAGIDQTVVENSIVVLDGTASFDPDNNSLSYFWTAPAGITLNSAIAPKPYFIAPKVSNDTNYTFSLRVNDGAVNSIVDDVVITVKQINKAPTANAGIDQTVNAGEIVTLDGSHSFDPNNDHLTFKWEAPTGITLSSTSIAKPSFTTPEVSQDTQLIFTLIVNDGKTDSSIDQVVVTVRKSNKSPIANAGNDQTINEKSTVTLDGSLSFDPEGNPITYKWTAPEEITLNSSSIQKPTFVAPEVTQDTRYIFTLVVNDGTMDSAIDQVVIIVKQVNKAPIANAGVDQIVNEGSLVSLDASASLDPDSDNLIYSWIAPEKVVLSDTKSNKPTFIAPEVKRDSTLIFTLFVNDGQVNSDPSTVKINVRNVIKVGIPDISTNDFKVYPNPATGVVTIDFKKNADSDIEVAVSTITGTIVLRKEINEAAKFQIDLSDQITGIYLLRIRTKSQEFICKIILKK